MKFKTLQEKNSQKGIALILAIVFLAILSVIGAVVMQVSTRDLSESAVILPNQQALYAADRAVEYALNRDIIINLGQNGEPPYEELYLRSTDPGVTNNEKVRLSNGNMLNAYHADVINSTGPGTLLDGRVTDEGPRTLPPHLAERHGSEFGANLYHVYVKATSKNLAAGEDETDLGPKDKITHIDANIVRLYKMDDDQIFRTSGGG